MNLYIDIETIGTEDPAIIAEIAAGIEPPANYCKPETIEAWVRDKKPALVAEAVSKTSFDGGLGRVICFGYAIDNGNPDSFVIGSELLLLKTASDLTASCKIGTHVIGHNVSWDIRFLWQRYIVNKIPPPPWLKTAAKAKPWDIGDTITTWNPERDKKIKLEKLCRILGVPTPKSELDGSKIWDAYRAGKLDEIEAYCRGDVEATRECYWRMAA